MTAASLMGRPRCLESAIGRRGRSQRRVGARPDLRRRCDRQGARNAAPRYRGWIEDGRGGGRDPVLGPASPPTPSEPWMDPRALGRQCGEGLGPPDRAHQPRLQALPQHNGLLTNAAHGTRVTCHASGSAEEDHPNGRGSATRSIQEGDADDRSTLSSRAQHPAMA